MAALCVLFLSLLAVLLQSLLVSGATPSFTIPSDNVRKASELETLREFSINNVVIFEAEGASTPKTYKLEGKLETNRGALFSLTPSVESVTLTDSGDEGIIKIVAGLFNVSVTVSDDPLPIGDVTISLDDSSPVVFIEEDRSLVIKKTALLDRDLTTVFIKLSKDLPIVEPLKLLVTVTDYQGNYTESRQVTLTENDGLENQVQLPLDGPGSYQVTVSCADEACRSVEQWVDFGPALPILIARPSLTIKQVMDMIEKDRENREKLCAELACKHGTCSEDAKTCKCLDNWTGDSCDTPPTTEPRKIDNSCRNIAPVIDHVKDIEYKNNGQTVEDVPYSVGTEALYSCDDGYSLESQDKSKLTCSDGNWNGDLPVCIEDPQPTKASAETTTTIVEPSTTTSTAESAPTIEATPTPDPVPPISTDKSCQDALEVDNANEKIDYKNGDKPVEDSPYPAGTVATYSCKEGSSLDSQDKDKSEATSVCKEDGTWDNHPACVSDSGSPEEDTPTKTSFSLADHAMEFAVAGLVVALVLSLAGYLLYHYRSKVSETLCGGKKPGLPWLRTKSPSRGGGRYSKLPRTMQEALHQD